AKRAIVDAVNQMRLARDFHRDRDLDLIGLGAFVGDQLVEPGLALFGDEFVELWRRLTIDASAIAGNILLVLCVAWGAAAAAGLTAGPHPLDRVSAAFGIFLLASFIAVGRRGMMTPP